MFGDLTREHARRGLFGIGSLPRTIALSLEQDVVGGVDQAIERALGEDGIREERVPRLAPVRFQEPGRLRELRRAPQGQGRQGLTLRGRSSKSKGRRRAERPVVRCPANCGTWSASRSLCWMAAVAAVIFSEKVLAPTPRRREGGRGIACRSRDRCRDGPGVCPVRDGRVADVEADRDIDQGPSGPIRQLREP